MPADATRDAPAGVQSASSSAVTVRVLLREPGLTRAGAGAGAGAIVELRLRVAARRRSDRERARIRFGAVSLSESVSVEAGEGESESNSRSSSVHVCWPAAATRESGLGLAWGIESAGRPTACAVGDRAEAEGRELMSLSLLLESESSSAPSPMWRKLGELLLLSLDKREGIETEGRRRDPIPRGRLARNAAFEGCRGKSDGGWVEVVDGVLSTD